MNSVAWSRSSLKAAVTLIARKQYRSIIVEGETIRKGGGAMSLEGIVIAEQVVSSPDHTFQAKV